MHVERMSFFQGSVRYPQWQKGAFPSLTKKQAPLPERLRIKPPKNYTLPFTVTDTGKLISPLVESLSRYTAWYFQMALWPKGGRGWVSK